MAFPSGRVPERYRATHVSGSVTALRKAVHLNDGCITSSRNSKHGSLIGKVENVRETAATRTEQRISAASPEPALRSYQHIASAKAEQSTCTARGRATSRR